HLLLSEVATMLVPGWPCSPLRRDAIIAFVGKVFDAIDAKLAGWIARQRMFFVGTAPSGGGGHVNRSPKGPIKSLRIFGPKQVGYLDLIGSGAETVAHLRENGRVVIMLYESK